MFDRLVSYLDSVRARDPSPRSRWEILIYPGVIALGLHRVAHWLYEAELFFFARVVNHFSRFLTAIDIHPGAIIGRNFFIDHGFTVIGETAEIGDNVTIYQCVTLGGTNPTNGKGGKRHPTLMDGVIVGSGAQVIGPITVGERARIGANAVVTDEVPEGATMIGLKARSTLVPAEDWIREFIPYGTPCDEPCEPAPTERVQLLEQQIAALTRQVEAMSKALPADQRAEGGEADLFAERKSGAER
ncbi:serine O-acetyltransferase EpsC [Aurantiacibacter aquimixticola]|uniref:Serine acetyltransferase n=1 Tax=Aurantiacibacter aquimixticola TaxID=1958945 RepID=A0A419RQU6_9SPHN|nr:serine O-acetyltransferase EpsC [Aurantiacibacter aquimixticola]RJY08151.1 serine acetyltransferase [Aurantiacibacter aquimixticola]